MMRLVNVLNWVRYDTIPFQNLDVGWWMCMTAKIALWALASLSPSWANIQLKPGIILPIYNLVQHVASGPVDVQSIAGRLVRGIHVAL